MKPKGALSPILGDTMAKYQKLAIAPDGEIVFRSTGRIVTKNVDVKGNRAYVDGRLYGYIGKGTKTEQARIAKTASSASRKKRAKIKEQADKIRKEGLKLQTPQTPATTATNATIKDWFKTAQLQADAVKYIRKKYGDRGTVEISKNEQALLNYSSVLNKAVRAGKISPAKATLYYARMSTALDDDARRKIWVDTADLFDKLDYKYEIHSRIKDSED